jgi:glucuronokinase
VLAESSGEDVAAGCRLSLESTIPRQVGLAGSSAIAIAALRALAARRELALEPWELAALALRAERDVLGIAAGPQDRVAQACGGLVFMDFGKPLGPDTATRLDPAHLPALAIGWDPAPGESSGVTHDDLRARFDRGDERVRAAMETFARLAREGRACLEAGDVSGLCARVDRNFDLRAEILSLRPRDVELVALARRSGAAAKFCGSGGAAVAVAEDPSRLGFVEAAWRGAGFESLRPRVSARASGGRCP